jgi:hypothetical protein
MFHRPITSFILTYNRTSFSLSLSHLMETGFCQDLKTAVSNSGTRELATRNSCCRGTRTLLSLLRLALAVAALLLDLATCGPGSGAISHTHSLVTRSEILKWVGKIPVCVMANWMAYWTDGWMDGLRNFLDVVCEGWVSLLLSLSGLDWFVACGFFWFDVLLGDSEGELDGARERGVR